jgi:transcriptional regulator with XRE-family HTH domain
MDKIKELSIKIKSLRERKGLSQDRFGSKIGVSGKSVSAYENGRCVPPLRILENICRVYDQSVFYIEDKNKENLCETLLVIKKHISKIYRSYLFEY